MFLLQRYINCQTSSHQLSFLNTTEEGEQTTNKNPCYPYRDNSNKKKKIGFRKTV